MRVSDLTSINGICHFVSFFFYTHLIFLLLCSELVTYSFDIRSLISFTSRFVLTTVVKLLIRLITKYCVTTLLGLSIDVFILNVFLTVIRYLEMILILQNVASLVVSAGMKFRYHNSNDLEKVHHTLDMFREGDSLVESKQLPVSLRINYCIYFWFSILLFLSSYAYFVLPSRDRQLRVHSRKMHY